ncbi:hypothetical protein, partial [Frankia sp. Cr1]|uniref:hypothetical protein n=1 Tax=Frankia sp. Cr1 TaxID=3073931 RepID=UPI002AD5A281
STYCRTTFGRTVGGSGHQDGLNDLRTRPRSLIHTPTGVASGLAIRARSQPLTCHKGQASLLAHEAEAVRCDE